MPLTLDGVRVTPGGTAAPPAQDADETLVIGGHVVRLQLGQPEREAVTAIRIGGLRHPRLSLRKPIALAVTWQETGVSVFDSQTNLWGEGEHLTGAIEDFQATLAELYLGLRERRDHLGPALQAEWDALQQWIDERP